MSELQEAGDGKSHSEVWNEIAQEEAGQTGGSPDNASERLDPPEEGSQDEGQPGADEEQARQGSDADRPAESENTDDIWANADPKLKEAFEAERARAAKAENTVKSNNGRLSQAQRELAELRARSYAPVQPQAKTGEEAPKEQADDPELAKVEEEYPEIAKPLIKVITDLRSEVESLKSEGAKRTEIEAKQAELAQQEAIAREEQALAEAHPDWDDIVKSQEFADWAVSQPRMVHEALRRNANGIVDGNEASKVLSDFKRDTVSEKAPDPLAQKRERQLDGNRRIPARSGAAPGDGTAGDYSSEWKRLAAEEQRREASRR